MQKPLNILDTSWRNQPTISVEAVRNIPWLPEIVPVEPLPDGNNVVAIPVSYAGEDWYALAALNENNVLFLVRVECPDGLKYTPLGFTPEGDPSHARYSIVNPIVTPEECVSPTYAEDAVTVFIDVSTDLTFDHYLDITETHSCSIIDGEPEPLGEIHGPGVLNNIIYGDGYIDFPVYQLPE